MEAGGCRFESCHLDFIFMIVLVVCCFVVFVARKIFLDYEKRKFALLIRIILPSMLHSMVVLWKFVSSDDIILERRIRCAISCIVGVSAPYSIC